MREFCFSLAFAMGLVVAADLWGGEAAPVAVAEPRAETYAPPAGLSAAERGLWLLLNKPYMRQDVTQEEFDSLWEIWPEPLHSQAENASADERWKMAFERYGFIEREDEESEAPLGYVIDADGGWTMNCLSCHGGKVAGRMIPGLGNTYFAFQTFGEDVLALRSKQRGGLTLAERASLAVPLSRSNGTTNAQIFSVALAMLRTSDLDLKQRDEIKALPMKHHDLDAPPWWILKKKRMLYIDGFVQKSHRVIMQFVLLPTNSGEVIRSWEDDFRDILAYAESVEAPKYPWPVDEELAARGSQVFVDNCSGCHGTYGADGEYPERMVPIDEVGTDRRRLDGLPLEHRRFFEQGWVGEEGKVTVVEEPEGYVAPPLDGIWASAPYFHNGSVPTLWHVLHPEKRPKVWTRRDADGYDTGRVGLDVVELESVPKTAGRRDARRQYFETGQLGKSAQGHDFPSQLDEEERHALLEYLKTL